MTVLLVVTLVIVAVAATAVVLTHDPVPQAVVASVFGLSLAMVFLAFEAPDVAMAVIVVGVVAVPLMVLVTMASIRGGEE
ncbi:MAG: DUF4040 domain-containing protein [Actinomycetota bacterium]|nr:DUF4040 domain-containing protein [Actinomycetota bacterium]